MARQAGGTVAINISANGTQAKKTFDEVGQAASRMPEQFSKAATAMSALDSVAGNMGSTAVRVTGNLSQLGALMATGGAVGIALAGLSAAVSAATYVWSVYQSQVRAVEDAQKSLDSVLEKRQTVLDAAKQRVADLRVELEHWGESSDKIRLAQLEGANATMNKSIPAVEAEVEAMRKKITTLENVKRAQERHGICDDRIEEEIALTKMSVEALESSLAKSRERLVVQREEVDLLRQRIALQEKDAAARSGPAPAPKVDRGNEDRGGLSPEEYEAFQARSRLYQQAAQERIELQQGVMQAEQEMWDKNAAAYERSLEEGTKALEAEEAKRAAARDRAQAQEMARQQQLRSTMRSAASSVGEAWGSAFASIASGNQSTAQAMIGAAFQTMRVVVNTAMAKAAAKVIASESKAGIAGVIAGAIGASMAMALIESLVQKSMGKFATGGVVTGGIPGVDSVPIMAQQGERVLTVEQTRSFDRLVQILERGGAGGGPTVVNNFQSIAAPTSAEAMRAARAFGRTLRAVGV